MQDAAYDSLQHYEFESKEPKWRIAQRLKVRPSRYSYLRNPEQYRPRLSDAETRRIARLLNRPESYVRDYYAERAA